MALKKFIIRPPGPPFRFLDLPPELRNRIYESLFLGLRMELWWATYIRRDNGSACERTCWTAYPPLYLEEDETDDFPPMLYVNRQIRAECIGLFFESALWGSEHGIWLVVRWLRALPQRYISAIKRLRFPIGGTGHKVQMLSEVLDDYSIELRGFEMTDMGDGWVLCEKRSEDAKILLLELDCGSPAHRSGPVPHFAHK